MEMRTLIKAIHGKKNLKRRSFGLDVHFSKLFVLFKIKTRERSKCELWYHVCIIIHLFRENKKLIEK